MSYAVIEAQISSLIPCASYGLGNAIVTTEVLALLVGSSGVAPAMYGHSLAAKRSCANWIE